MPPRIGIALKRNESLQRMEEARGRVEEDAFWERRRRRGSSGHAVGLPGSCRSSADQDDWGEDDDDEQQDHIATFEISSNSTFDEGVEVDGHGARLRAGDGLPPHALSNDQHVVSISDSDNAGGRSGTSKNRRSLDLQQQEPAVKDESHHRRKGPVLANRHMAALLQGREFTAGHSASLLDKESLHFLSLDEEGKTMKHETTLRDIGSLDWKGRRDLIHKTLVDPSSGRVALIISLVIMFSILLSTTCYCLETMPQFQGMQVFADIETVTIILFTCEYLLKLATASHLLAFIRSPLNVVDVLAILPWYIELMTPGSGGQGTAVLRIIRLARMFKLGGRYEKFGVVGKAMLTSVDVLGVLLFLMVIAVVIFSTLIYYCEHPSPTGQNMIPQDFDSIPESFWWAMVTVNTVGYGDVVPMTTWGKLVGCCLMTVGLLIMALPISVIGTNFTQEWLDYKEYLSQQEAMKHLPENVREFEDLLSEHVANVEHITTKYSETEAELDYLRMKLQDKIHQIKVLMAEQREERSDENNQDRGEDRMRTVGFVKLFGKQSSSKFRDRCERELQEIQDLVQRIQSCNMYLGDLMLATQIFRMDGFEVDLKAVRMKYKQLEFIKEESQSLRQHLDEVESKTRKVDPHIDFLDPKFVNLASRRQSFGEPLMQLQSKAWKKIKGYSKVNHLTLKRLIKAEKTSGELSEDVSMVSSRALRSSTLPANRIQTGQENDQASRRASDSMVSFVDKELVVDIPGRAASTPVMIPSSRQSGSDEIEGHENEITMAAKDVLRDAPHLRHNPGEMDHFENASITGAERPSGSMAGVATASSANGSGPPDMHTSIKGDAGAKSAESSLMSDVRHHKQIRDIENGPDSES